MRSYRNSDPSPPIMVGAPPPSAMRPPKADWDRAPWNRWSFQHVREVVPTAPIRRAARPAPLPDDGGRLDDLAFPRHDGGSATFAAMLDETYTDAMLVWKDGRILHESYHNGMTPASLHLLQSVSKSLTASAAGWLIEDGLIDPAAPVTAHLPELAATAWNGATVRQVMDMTTGVRFDESYEDPASDVGRMDYASGWKPAPGGVDASGWPQCMWDQILSLTTVEADHGARFRYRSIETDVLGHMMERVTGQRLPQILSERLWQPLGCAEDASITVDSAGYGLACGGISAALRDMARFGIALLNDGRIDGRQAIAKGFVDDVRRGRHGLFDAESRTEFPNGRYRNQFWIEDAGRETVLCLGVFGQMVYVSPESGLVAVKFSTWPDFLDSGHLLLALDAVRAAARETA